MKRFSFFLFVVAILSPASHVSAQEARGIPPSEMVMDRSHIANPRYEAMVRAAMMRMGDNFRFGRLRTLYVDTRQYDPLGDETIAKMQDLAYKAQNEEDISKRGEALDAYRNLVMEHMANIRVVAQALSFAKLDSVYGSPKFFSWMRKGLVRDILSIGDGKTLRSAYEVITITEETVLLGQLGLRVLDTQSSNESYYYYNMHEVENIRDGQKSTIFVNTTRPLRFLNAKKHEAGGDSFTIIRQ